MASPAPGTLIKRRSLLTRAWHWINAIAVIILLGSGLGISNAHPRLYWGKYGANFDPAWLRLPRFPSWITIPASYNLAISRRWHLFFALVLAFGLFVYMVASLINHHVQRDLAIKRGELAPRHLAADLRENLAFRFHDPDHPGRYNTLQKLSYIAIIFVLLPLMILTGLTMSPGMDAAWPWLLDLFAGRQSARSIHFICAALVGTFIIVHLALVILAGVGNELRSVVTGRWRVPDDVRQAEPVAAE